MSTHSGELQAPTGGNFENTLVGTLSRAIELHQAGDLEPAEEGYRKALEMAPDHPYALHYLGVITHQKGETENAIPLITRAIEQLPDFADALTNLGAMHHALGNMTEAEKNFRKAAELNPHLPEAHSNLAAVLSEAGKMHDAIEAYLLAHEVAPENPKFVKRLADHYLAQELYGDAIIWFKKFIELAGDDAEACNNLGYACERLEELENAAVWYEKAVELCPDSPEINNNVASILSRIGRGEEANDYFEKALSWDPENWQDHANLAGTYVNRKQNDKALPLYEQLVEQQPENSKIFNDFGVALSSAGRFKEGEEKLLRAIDLDPEFAAAYANLGGNFMQQARRHDAIECFKKVIALDPRNLQAHCNICLALAYENRLAEAYIYAQAAVILEDYKPHMFTNPHKVFRGACDFDAIDALGNVWDNVEQATSADYSSNFLEMLVYADSEENVERFVDLHRKWAGDALRRLAGEPLPPLPPRRRAKSDKIRLGIISSDLRQHSVSKFVLPVLENYDRENFEIVCFAPRDYPTDPVQNKIKGLVRGFKVLDSVSDREFAQAVRDEEIDILFELNGFTRDTRIKVFAHRAAPVQVFWLGYPFTTGIEEMDYIILDEHVKPTNPEWMVEKPILLPNAWVCFGAFEPEPIAEEPPMERNGFVTFGSLNNPYKLTPHIISLWSEILKRVPNSRFLYVRPEGDSVILCSNLVKEFERNGVGGDRLYLVNNKKLAISHLSYYDEIDIALDTYPLTGGTTTADTLWMGVPLVSKVGPSMHQRLSYSFLANVGLEQLAVQTDEEYIEKAVELAADPEPLRLLRRELRGVLLDSALCRSEDYGRNFCAAMLEIAKKHNLR